MALSVKYNNESLPEGQEVDLGGFLVENGGEAVELTESNEAGIMERSGMMPKDYFDSAEDAEASGTGLLTQDDLDVMVPPAAEEDETEEVEEPKPVEVVAAKVETKKEKEVNE